MNTTNKLIGCALALSVLASLPNLTQAQTTAEQNPVLAQTSKSTATISLAEKKTLLVMREEEKMARDVYQALYKIWKLEAFKNIAASEQKHMDAILKKIKLFGLVDPAKPSAGQFTSPEIKTIYNKLMAQGKRSYIDALRVGATIEDMDIRDLSVAINATNNLPLKTTYQNLQEGSKNHLRAFVGLLQKQKVTYKPQYISQTLFDAILGI